MRIHATFSFSAGPPAPSGALAIIEIHGDVDAALLGLGIAGVEIGAAKLRRWGEVDELVIARPEHALAMLFPHASPAIMARATAALLAAGIARRETRLPLDAGASMDDRLADALGRAQSGMAIDLLLDQPRRWALAQSDPAMRMPSDVGRVLRRLIDPPLVVALGPPNVGKSSMLNALAGRSVSIVADEPGTTRDHVGVLLDLGGLVVRYIDTPGVSGTPRDALDAEAQQIAMRVAAGADLLLLCADATTGFLPPVALSQRASVVRVGLRSDLGEVGDADVHVSARTGAGLADLVGRLREELVPVAVLRDGRAWAFWDDSVSTMK